MSNSIKAVLIITIVALVAVAICVVYMWPHLWRRVGTAEGGPQVKVTVYKSSDGNLLFWVQEDSLVAPYIYYPATNKFGIANLSQFFVLPVLIYSKDSPVPVVYSDNRIKVEEDMDIVLENETLRFTAWGRRRIVADLKSY